MMAARLALVAFFVLMFGSNCFAKKNHSNSHGSQQVEGWETDLGYTIVFKNDQTCNVSGVISHTVTTMNLICPPGWNDMSDFDDMSFDSFNVISYQQVDECNVTINATSTFACHKLVQTVGKGFKIMAIVFGSVLLFVCCCCCVCCICKCRKSRKARKAREALEKMLKQEKEPQPVAAASAAPMTQMYTPLMQPRGPFQPQQAYMPMYPSYQVAVPTATPAPAAPPTTMSDEQLARALQAEYNRSAV